MKYIKYIALAGLVGLTSSCIDDLLNRPATTEVSSDLFWTSTDDALSSSLYFHWKNKCNFPP